MPSDLYKEIALVREDVAYIRAKIDALPDHEERLRKLEKWKYSSPVSAVVALLSALTALRTPHS